MDNQPNNGGPDEGPSSLMYHTDPEVTAALARIEANTLTLVQAKDDHEARLRSLEKWRWGLAGAIGALGLFFKGIPTWLK